MSSWVRMVSTLLPVVIITGACSTLLFWSRQADNFPLRQVEVENENELRHVSSQEIKAIVSKHLSKGFFWLEVEAVQEDLKQLPWIAFSRIRRIWPDKITLTITEKIPQARFGEEQILTTEGSLFKVSGMPISEKLPSFKGPEDLAKEMQQQYLSLLELLGPIGLTIQALELAPNGVWRIMLDNGIAIILGKVAITERLARFVLAYQGGLQAHVQRIAYVDLRYTNGMALGWKEGI